MRTQLKISIAEYNKIISMMQLSKYYICEYEKLLFSDMWIDEKKLKKIKSVKSKFSDMIYIFQNTKCKRKIKNTQKEIVFKEE